jgi:thiamine-phosphate pyrophosphorylase
MREVGGPGFMVGASVHSVAEARAVAAEGADFIVFGPVFDTPSKRPYGPPQGLAALGQVTAAVATPVLAIGGITADRVRDILAVGAVGVGVISAILAAARPRDATRAFLDALGSA